MFIGKKDKNIDPAPPGTPEAQMDEIQKFVNSSLINRINVGFLKFVAISAGATVFVLGLLIRLLTN